MDIPPTSSVPTLVLVLLSLANGIATPINLFFGYLFSKRLHSSEDKKTEADARHIDVATIIEASETIQQMGATINKQSLQKSIDDHTIMNLGWDKIDLNGQIKMKDARIKVIEDQLALAKAKGFVE